MSDTTADPSPADPSPADPSPADPSTEEIPVVEQVAAATRTAVPEPVGVSGAALVAGRTLGDADTEVVAARALGDAGSLRSQRLEPRRALTAAVAAIWSAALFIGALFGAGALYRLAPDVPRLIVGFAGVVCAAAAVILLSDLDSAQTTTRPDAFDDEDDGADGVDGGEIDDIDFGELQWKRRELYALRPVDVVWAAVELSPVVVFVAALFV